MSDALDTISLQRLKEENLGISQFAEIRVREISDAPDDVAVSFQTHKSDISHQTPTGEHVFLVNRQEFVSQLHKLIEILDPTVEQMTLRILEKIEQKLE